VWTWFFAGQSLDTDGDGYGIGGACEGPLDCENDDPAVYPGALEICDDGKDNNCDGLTDTEDPSCPQNTDDDSGDDDNDDNDSGADDDNNDAVDDDQAATGDDDNDDTSACGC
jgi:hypothetical protein